MTTEENQNQEIARRNLTITVCGLQENLTPLKIREIFGSLASEGWKCNAGRVTVRLNQ